MFDASDIETNRLETIYPEGTAHVEDFRIRPLAVGDGVLEMRVRMRIGGGEAVYYLDSTVTYGGEEEGHRVTIRRRGAGVVDEFETDVVTASPADEMEAVQALHETHVQAADDWYQHARAAEQAGDASDE